MIISRRSIDEPFVRRCLNHLVAAGELTRYERGEDCLVNETVAFLSELGTVCTVSRKMQQMLAQTCLRGLSVGRLVVLAANSHALPRAPMKGSRVAVEAWRPPDVNGVSFTLRDKPQYRRSNFVRRIVDRHESQLPIEFVNVLVDVEPCYQGDEFEPWWERNLVYLARESASHCVRFSKQVSSEDRAEIRQAVITSDVVRREVERHTTNRQMLAGFQLTPEFVEQQLLQYVFVGAALENAFPDAIMVDTQNTNYPFEQPYYNLFREKLMPIVRFVEHVD